MKKKSKQAQGLLMAEIVKCEIQKIRIKKVCPNFTKKSQLKKNLTKMIFLSKIKTLRKIFSNMFQPIKNN